MAGPTTSGTKRSMSASANALWEREGCPEGKADEYWYRTRAFEES